ncbi:hypothetical protein THIOKS11570038 [Thiocapsa sp. KS1]|nr:hypothetical protein THIOKS11570038 [Thiocapsa sp. KS1]
MLGPLLPIAIAIVVEGEQSLRTHHTPPLAYLRDSLACVRRSE